jgi:hypothetical protein
MLRHEFLQYVFLRYALSIDGESGRETSWGNLGNIIREAGIDSSDPEMMDALMLLSARNLLALQKWVCCDGNWFLFDYSEFPNGTEFFNGFFRLLATPEGRAYFHELEAKANAAMRAAAPVKRNRIGFHA